jgi:hypothetical protein
MFYLDADTGRPLKLRGGAGEELIFRSPADPAPCGTDGCPRRFKGLEAWSAKNIKAAQRWMEGKALGYTRAERADPLFRQNVAMLEDVMVLVNSCLTARAVWGR